MTSIPKKGLKNLTRLGRSTCRLGIDVASKNEYVQLDVLELRNDIDGMLSREIHQNRKLKCERVGAMRNRLGQSEISNHWTFQDIQLRMNPKGKENGFRIRGYMDLEGFGWHASYWGSTKGTTPFDYDFFQRLGKSIKFPKKVQGGYEICYPGTGQEHKENKFIHMWCRRDSKLSRQLLIEYHELFRRKILSEITRHLRRKHLI